MEINYWKWEKLSESEREKILSRSEIDISAVKESVSLILEKVRTEKDKALYYFTKEFDKVDLKEIPLRVSEEEFTEAESIISDKVKEAIKYYSRGKSTSD